MKKKKKSKIIFILVAFAVCLLVGCLCGVLVSRALNKDAGDDIVNQTPEQTEKISDSPAEPESETSTDNIAEGTDKVGNEQTAVAEYDENNSYIRVINRSYPIPADYIAGTGELSDIEGKQLESNACEALRRMVADLRAEGLSIIVQSGYRTDGDQEYLYNRQIGRQGGDELKAATISAVPLTSEHQAGLAVDLSTDGSLTEAFGSTPQGQWLKEHCAKYGYILRYPKGKEAVTGIISEPWHFRYVGSSEAARDIMDSGFCLEEYYGKYLKPEDIEPYLPYLQ